jgi:LytR cell envelope-related transcriptional attenuator
MHAGEQLGLDDGSLAGRVGLVRGLAVVAVALVVGAFVLFRGTNDQGSIAASASSTTLSDEGSVADPDQGGEVAKDTIGDATAIPADTQPNGATTASVTAATAVAGADPTPTTAVGATSAQAATPPPDGPAGITVLVLNAASAKGVAGKGSEILDAAGYKMMAPKNADALGKSKILYREGKKAAADAVAATLKADPAKVVAPLNPSAPPIATIGQADVIVVIGSDGLIKV